MWNDWVSLRSNNTCCEISCFFLKTTAKKLRGTNTLLVPPTWKLGGPVSPGPHGCCAYGLQTTQPSCTDYEDTELFLALNDLADGCARLCVLVDFNLHRFNWDSFTYPDNQLYTTAADFICNHGLTQLIDEPTCNNSILDFIMCSADVLCCDEVFFSPPLANSDHVMVSFNVSLSHIVDEPIIGTRPNFSKAHWHSIICYYLSTINWLDEMSCCLTGVVWWSRV